MDIIGAFFLLLFLLIITVSNFAFIKGLTKNQITSFKYKLIYFLICIVSLFAAIFIYYVFQTYILIDLFDLRITNSTYKARFIVVMSIAILNIIGNFLSLKFYLKRIYLKEKTKTNEIELIGKE